MSTCLACSPPLYCIRHLVRHYKILETNFCSRALTKTRDLLNFLSYNLELIQFFKFIWWQFIDDIFMIWTHREEHLKTFIGYLNSTHPSINFFHEYSNSLHQTLPFLDVQVHLISNHIQTDLHTKSTDKHQYLFKTSCHPKNTKKAILFSLFLQIYAYVQATLSLTDEAENSSSSWPNMAVAAPHYKEMPIAFAQFHITQPFNSKNRNLRRLTKHPFSYPSTLRFLK